MNRLLVAVLLTDASAFKRQEGQTLAEYALILTLIAVVAVVALTFLGGTIKSLFSKVGNSV